MKCMAMSEFPGRGDHEPHVRSWGSLRRDIQNLDLREDTARFAAEQREGVPEENWLPINRHGPPYRHAPLRARPRLLRALVRAHRPPPRVNYGDAGATGNP